MNWGAADVIAVLLCTAMCVMLVFPMFRHECMDDRAAEVYEQMMLASVAIVSAYIGSRLGSR